MALPGIATCGVHVLNDDDTPGDLVGAAVSTTEAINIACAAYIARQDFSAQDYLRIGVFDATSVLVAAIGKKAD